MNIIKPKTREEWLSIRKNGIGSSEVASILGLNPFQYAYQLWLNKTGKETNTEENFFMKAGHYLEDAVSQFWQDETGKVVIKSSAGDWLIQDEKRPWMQVSPDRTFWIKEGSKEKGILECKTTQRSIDAEAIPMHWFCQVQYQLGVAGMRHGSIAWLTAGREFGYKDIELDDTFFKYLTEAVDRFWNYNVKENHEPALTSVQDVVEKYPTHTEGKQVEVSQDIYNNYCELVSYREQIKDLEAKKDECEERLKLAFGDAEALTYMGTPIATWKAPKPSLKFDARIFKEKYPNLYDEFCLPSQGARRLLIK
jgi:putative phage-type endonuclease